MLMTRGHCWDVWLYNLLLLTSNFKTQPRRIVVGCCFNFVHKDIHLVFKSNFAITWLFKNMMCTNILTFFHQWWNLKQQIIASYFPPGRILLLAECTSKMIWSSNQESQTEIIGTVKMTKSRVERRLGCSERGREVIGEKRMLRSGLYRGIWLACGHLHRKI